jgi:hypothetical protein
MGLCPKTPQGPPAVTAYPATAGPLAVVSMMLAPLITFAWSAVKADVLIRDPGMESGTRLADEQKIVELAYLQWNSRVPVLLFSSVPHIDSSHQCQSVYTGSAQFQACTPTTIL